MSTWRSKALELFPALRPSVLHADDYQSLWRDVHREFRVALAKGQTDFGTPFFQYAAWTLSLPPQTGAMGEVSRLAAEVFYEFADDLQQWIRRADFMLAQNGLRYHLGAERYAEFEHRFLEHTPGYVKKSAMDGST